MLDNIRIVLLHTSHPGNIGASARAIKNMGLAKLYLVAPQHYPSLEAEARASGAKDILHNAVVCASLTDAIADCQLILGASARNRSLPLPYLTPRECAEVIHQEPATAQVAILFGEERFGLTNQQIAHCHYQILIPHNPAYPSLNLAAAVQIITYELYLAACKEPLVRVTEPTNLVTTAEMETFYMHLEALLIDKQFLNPAQPKRLMLKIRRLLSRVRLEREELNILYGILTTLTA